MRRPFRTKPKRAPTGPSVNGDIRQVYDSTRPIGYVVERDGGWKAVASGGRDIGRYETSVEAARAVVRHHHAGVRAGH